jgi:hypothetical protein
MMPNPYIDSFGDNPVKTYYRDLQNWIEKDSGDWQRGYGELAPSFPADIKGKPEEQMMMQIILAALAGAGPRGRYEEKYGKKIVGVDPLERANALIGQDVY